MNEIDSTPDLTSAEGKEVRHALDFATVVIGARHENERATYRTGRVYNQVGTTFTMAEFMVMDKSTGLLVRTEKGEAFYVMRGAPKGVAANPQQQISMTNITQSQNDNAFVSRVLDAESSSDKSFTVGEEFAQGTSPVVSIIVDTGERSGIEEIDRNTAGQSLFDEEFKAAQSIMQGIERAEAGNIPHF